MNWPNGLNLFQNRDNLKSKELHIEMMRKKMNRLDEESNQRSALSVDRDDAILSLQVSNNCTSVIKLATLAKKYFTISVTLTRPAYRCQNVNAAV